MFLDCDKAYCVQASGVQVADECKMAFQDMKLGYKYRYVVFKLTDDLKRIVVETRAAPGSVKNVFLYEIFELSKSL